MLDVLEHHVGEGNDLVGVGASASRRHSASQEMGVGGAKLGFGGGKLEVVFPYEFEEGANVVDVDSGVGIKSDDGGEVGGDALEAFDCLVDDLNELKPWAALLPYDMKPLDEQFKRLVVFLPMVVWWNEGTRLNMEKVRHFPK